MDDIYPRSHFQKLNNICGTVTTGCGLCMLPDVLVQWFSIGGDCAPPPPQKKLSSFGDSFGFHNLRGMLVGRDQWCCQISYINMEQFHTIKHYLAQNVNSVEAGKLHWT